MKQFTSFTIKLAASDAVSQAQSNLYSQSSGRVSNVNITTTTQSSGGWTYANSQASGYCSQ